MCALNRAKQSWRCVYTMCVCVLMSPLSQYNEFPRDTLTFHPCYAFTPSSFLSVLFPKHGPINPLLPPVCLFRYNEEK